MLLPLSLESETLIFAADELKLWIRIIFTISLAGDKVSCKGPCGGFEYRPNVLQELTLLASGGGITPGMQLLRYILTSKQDTTKLNLLFYSESYEDILYRELLQQYAGE